MFNKVKMTVIATSMVVAPLMASESFGGIGASVYQSHNGAKIIDVIPGTPAAESKLQAGDLILSVDGEKLKGKNIEESTEILRGLNNKPLEIVFVSHGDTLSTVLRRIQITVANLEAKNVESRLGQKSEYDAAELQDYAESIESDKQLVAVLKKGAVVKSDATVNAKSLNGVFVTRTKEFSPKAKTPTVEKTSSVKLRNVSRTGVGFNIETAGRAIASITTADGTVIARASCEHAQAGYNSLKWNLENVPSGHYTVTVEHNGFVSSRSVLLK